jgi:hypothetical protein
MLFSPCGKHLVVPTSNGAFLWDVATGTKRLKLPTPSNPGYFSFSADGGELLARSHGTGEMARIAIPTGELIARFLPKYKFRLDGTGCLGPGNGHVLQLGCEGMFLVLDATTGKVLLERQLERTGCSGEVYWLPALGQVVIAQSSVADRHNRNEPCALWRWPWPLADSSPERLPGKWAHLTTALVPAQDALLLHHQPDPAAPMQFAIDVVDMRTFAVRRRIECGGISIPRPALSCDGRAWAVTTWGSLQVGIDDARVDLPIQLGAADFSPTQDLVAISGAAGFVAPRAELARLRATLQLHQDEGALNQRGYARGTTWPGRVLPPRFVVYSGPDGFAFEVEAIAGRKYVPTDTVIRATRTEVLAALAAAVAAARDATLPGGDRDRRDFQVGRVGPPAGTWTNAVAVTLASDAIDLWPLKPDKDGGFKLHWYPIAAIAADTKGQALWDAIEAMLGKPRKAKA